jgi:NAD+ synthase (glutamine-hydrolysing)
MRIALAQINLHVGNFRFNLDKMLDALKKARAQSADIVVFPELTVCGYPPRDLLFSAAFVEQCLQTVEAFADACRGIGAIVGGPSPNCASAGKGLFNTAFLLYDGKVQEMYQKGLLPTYDVFSEYRYFEPAGQFHTVSFGGRRIALTVCEDVWNIDGQGLYQVNPPDMLMTEHPEIMINISASPFAWNHRPQRLKILAENARKHKLPLFSTNLIGGQTDLLFDGVSAVCNADGKLVDTLPAFEEAVKVYDLDEVNRLPELNVPAQPTEEEKYVLMRQALVMGVRDYFSKTGLKKAVLGLSGGIDSALTMVLAVEALGAENVWAVLLPGTFSSDHSVADAKQLAVKMGVHYDIISINDVVQGFEQSLDKYFKDTPSGIAEENIQARARAVILMGLSNKFGHMLLNTSNKSEAAVGYGTLYGDMCGGLSVIGDVYKTEVYGISRLINKNEEVIPWNTINKAPSAELKPDQKDTDSLPEYELLDAILFRLLEKQEDTMQIIRAGFDSEVVKKVARMLYFSEYKRYQSPPILRVSPKCLGIGREMPLEARYG